jgi:hypothetical protein
MKKWSQTGRKQEQNPKVSSFVPGNANVSGNRPGSTTSASAMQKLDPLSVMSILDGRNAKGRPFASFLNF